MSTSKLIAKESLTAYERWELPNVGEPDAPEPPQPTAEEIDAAELRELLSAERLEEIRREAQKEGFEQGVEQGFEQGRREGMQAGQTEVAAQAQRLGQILTAMAEPLNDVNERVEDELVQLALAVARQVMRRELASDPAQVIAVVREAVGALPSHAERIQVFLHPEDAALVREHIAGTDTPWRIAEEPALTRGGCRITSENSRIDATLESRVAEVMEKLMGGADDQPSS